MNKGIITVIGIGRVGLPFALVIAQEGYKVFGIGRDESKIESLKKGKMPFIEEGGDLLKEYVNKSFFPTLTYDSIKKSDAIILTLGTPIDENMNPVLNQINSVIKNLIPLLKKDHLIILRSTISPNTTKYIKETIELKTKFKVGRDIFLAFCPERIAEGKSITEIKEIPQIIGGADIRSTKRARLFFESLGIQCLTTDATSAELAKLFSNMYRYISFAIANEFFVIAENFNRDISEIVNLVNQGYKRNGLAIPGFSAGPCLFKDGFFLINDNPYLDLITASWKINESMPLFLVKKLKERINLKGKKVVILGVAFKAEIDDIRESLSFKLRKALLREHAEVVLHDPYVKHYSQQTITKSLTEALEGAHAVIIGTNHKEYTER
ncbi:MAG TPA: nucleotide sugar dehydrogenase, partial [Verrucomicrobiae bacterium]|nr:nucleotide sugar dehydrogenase [Verrucomicrobiae bacterium]